MFPNARDEKFPGFRFPRNGIRVRRPLTWRPNINPNFNNFQLLQENEDIGKMISSGRLAKLEGELSMQKNLCEEMKKNQAEMDDFVQVHTKHDRN